MRIASWQFGNGGQPIGRWSVRLVGGALILAGCARTPEPSTAPSGLQFSRIEVGDDMPSGFEIADTVPAGNASIIFFTFGSSGCTTPGGQAVEAKGSVTTITSYDVAVDSATICTMDLATFRRSVTVTLSPGDATLRLRGRKASGVGVIEKRVTVIP